MSLVIQREGGQPVHFPKSDVFKFDDEVAEIFENMAERSIPMYSEFHRLHASLVRPRIEELLLGGQAILFDIGASTGRWFRTLRRQFGVKSFNDMPGLLCYAFDNSDPMLAKIRAEFPEVLAINLDLAQPGSYSANAHIATMFYVLQFLPPQHKFRALQWVYSHLAEDGVLFLGQKEDMTEDMPLFQDEYIRFRLRNGYTQGEIDAKSAALKNSMWCSTPQELIGMLLQVGFRRVVETTRWLQFSTLMAVK